MTDRPSPSPKKRFRLGLATVFVLMLPLGVAFLALKVYLDNRPIAWVEFDPSALERNLKQGRVVLVFFHADWDPMSHAIEKFEFEAEEFQQYARSSGVVYMRADYTDDDPTIRKALRSVGANSTPKTVIYGPALEPVVLHDLQQQTPMIVNALEQARRSVRAGSMQKGRGRSTGAEGDD